MTINTARRWWCWPLLNALKIVDKRIEDIKVVVNGIARRGRLLKSS